MTRTKASLVTLAAVIFMLVAYLAPSAHAINGGTDGDPIQGIVYDDAPSLVDGVGDASDTDGFTDLNFFMLSRPATAVGDDTTLLDPHPPLIRVRTQYQVWSRDVLLTEALAGHQEVHVQTTIVTEYYFWHGFAGQTNKVAPFGVDLCYAFKGGKAPSLLWQGISADATWFDDIRGIDVKDLRTGDKGVGGCKHWDIPVAHREWLLMLQHPSWLADGWINWALDGDQSFHWHSARIDDSKWLSPAKDPVVTTKSGNIWHNIYKTW